MVEEPGEVPDNSQNDDSSVHTGNGHGGHGGGNLGIVAEQIRERHAVSYALTAAVGYLVIMGMRLVLGRVFRGNR